MSWSYSGNPSDSDLDLIRFMIGDTNGNDPELQDEEIQYEIDENVSSSGYFSPLKTSITLLRRIMAKYKQLVDEKVGDVDVKWNQRFRNLQKTLGELEAEHASTNLGSAYAGGISVSDKHTSEQNTDRFPPAFTVGFGDSKRDPNTRDSIRSCPSG